LGYFAGAIIEGPESWYVRPVGEVFFEGEGSEAPVKSGLLGAIWRINDKLALDTAVRLASAAGSTEFELRVGLTFAVTIGFPQ
jgi:hypothetical protein